MRKYLVTEKDGRVKRSHTCRPRNDYQCKAIYFVFLGCGLILKLLAFHGCYPAGGVLLAKSVADDSYILSTYYGRWLFALLLILDSRCVWILLVWDVEEHTSHFLEILLHEISLCRSQWPRGLRRGSTAGRLLGLRVRIPLWTWMSVCCECCVVSGRGLCDEPITRPEESRRLWCVWVWSIKLMEET